MSEKELRFYPQGRPEVVARSGKELAAAGIYVLPQVVANTFGENHAQEYEAAMKERRG